MGWLDAYYLAFYADDGDVFSDTEGAREDDGQAGHHVAQYAVHRQSNAGTGDSKTCDQRQQFYAEVCNAMMPNCLSTKTRLLSSRQLRRHISSFGAL